MKTVKLNSGTTIKCDNHTAKRLIKEGKGHLIYNKKWLKDHNLVSPKNLKTKRE